MAEQLTLDQPRAVRCTRCSATGPIVIQLSAVLAMPTMPNDYARGLASVNGHVISSLIDRYPAHRSAFCPTCGKPTIDACPSCDTPMRGSYMGGAIGGPGWTPPAHCYNCGEPFPWTTSAKESAEELIDLLEVLDPDERVQLKGTLDDLMSDSSRTEVAAIKFKLLARKAGGEGATALRTIVTSVATEAAKRLILGGP